MLLVKQAIEEGRGVHKSSEDLHKDRWLDYLHKLFDTKQDLKSLLEKINKNFMFAKEFNKLQK